ncbi:hypothetical protein GGI25_004745 [Coemansia spiralis]|uniref:Uncharacterized protein n=2 Tax=Coemansia TaxID=4863 RepID=A0A9W8G5Z9_9FUNG|nr:hypothetical protein BX070DRAFT_227177 [Coemansia spiralis]KAJ1989719.1 hypothetical protein EDC05_004517 [Coemansia umbellata]KAJ2620526.1 hypothetical protein GGI26_004933 [Coemansia sp. RSA 1358]KAJ2673410.1 hypothetical protein GGI25_004745 [Coemansia spiralis]
MAKLPFSTTNTYGEHGLLAKWAIAGHVFDIISIVVSAFIVLVVIGSGIWDRIFFSRMSFRLIIWIAIPSIIFSACRICTYSNSFMKSQSEIQLRVISWLSIASELCIVFVCALISFNLVLTVHFRKIHIARRLQIWYEYIAIALALVIAHPILYIYKNVEWDPNAQVMLFDGQVLLHKRLIWAIYLAWAFASIIFSLGVSLWLACSAAFMQNPKVPGNSSTITAGSTISANGVNNTDINGSSKYLEDPDHVWAELAGSSSREQKNIFIPPIALRVASYPLLPLATQIWPIVCGLAPGHTLWLYRLAFVIPSIQGILCLALLVINPAAGELWSGLCDRFAFKKQNQTLGQGLGLDFANLNASTIHLSPYQSRHASVTIS